MNEQDRLQRLAAGERDVDRVIDAALRSIARPADVDLRRQVLVRLDQADQNDSASWLARPRLLVASAAAIATILAGLLLGPQLFERAPEERMAQGTAPAEAALPSRSLPAASPVPAPSAGEVSKATAPSNTEGRKVSRRPATVQAWRWPAAAEPLGDVHQLFPLGAEPDPEPLLPGAPTGELGEGLRPMAALRPITILPIETAPPISELSRPVSELTATARPAETSTTGSSGGRR
jgi:hypothetical protein